MPKRPKKDREKSTPRVRGSGTVARVCAESTREGPCRRSRAANKRIGGRFWRLVIPSLVHGGTFPRRPHPLLQRLKADTLDKIQFREASRGLEHWCVAWQTHAGSGRAHLDILLGYSKRVMNSPTHYDYLVKHGHLTRYRTINAAMLEYGHKQDTLVLANYDSTKVIVEQSARKNLYALMQAAMLKDPFGFNPHEWLTRGDLWRAVAKTNVNKAVSLVRARQQVECNGRLRMRPGIKKITPELINGVLSESELAVYRSWPGYRTIVDHLNQMSKWGYARPHKTANLLIVGAPNTGKTRLALEVERYCPVYYKGVSNWFPSYRSGVYTMTLWNEFTLSAVPYNGILNFLEGVKMDLQYKGGSVCRTDNQLTYMTSNLPLRTHINARFRTREARRLADAALRARITEVVLPKGNTLFVLLKLIISREPTRRPRSYTSDGLKPIVA